jgi:hypothetical protein
VSYFGLAQLLQGPPSVPPLAPAVTRSTLTSLEVTFAPTELVRRCLLLSTSHTHGRVPGWSLVQGPHDAPIVGYVLCVRPCDESGTSGGGSITEVDVGALLCAGLCSALCL